MQFNELNEDNFLLFAIKNYENPQAVTKEDFDKVEQFFWVYFENLIKNEVIGEYDIAHGLSLIV